LLLTWDEAGASPSIAAVDRALERDQAEFRTDVESFASREVIDAAVACGRYELPPLLDARYVALVDPYSRTKTRRELSIDHGLKRLRKLCPSSRLPSTGATLPVKFSKVLSPALRVLRRKVCDRTVEPSANL
jgi:hypothetical protein